MKLFKKLTIALICTLCAVCVCLSFAACGSDPDANLDEGTYVFYVYYEGTTPVEGAQIMICYNISDTQSTCYANPVTTDSNGRAEFNVSSLTSYSASYNPNGFCVHFNELAGDTTPVGFPDGYTYPSGSQKITLNGNAVYETAWYITAQKTTFTLVKA